jgi:hypothetical protein
MIGVPNTSVRVNADWPKVFRALADNNLKLQGSAPCPASGGRKSQQHNTLKDKRIQGRRPKVNDEDSYCRQDSR